MKTISIVIPTYNEEVNIPLIYDRIISLFHHDLQQYKYEILFIDNCSTDESQSQILKLAKNNKYVKAIFNAKNFGFSRSTFYGITQSLGDCCILLFADMQDPPDLITEFVKQWERGYKIVIGIKNKSKENKLMYWIRSCYYAVLRKICEVDHIEQFDGFGLYDKSFLDVLRALDDPMPYLRGMVAELGYARKEIYYTQEKRMYGKSNFDFFNLYDTAMLGITSYSKIIMRLATLFGFGIAIFSLLIAGLTFVYKILNWDTFPVGNAAISIGVFFFGAVQLFFIGILGEYVLNINTRILHRPLVIENRRINFEKGIADNEE